MTDNSQIAVEIEDWGAVVVFPSRESIGLKIEREQERFVSHSKMALSIVEIKRVKDRCTPKDLRAKGYTMEEVTRYWHLAHSIASLAIIRISESGEGDRNGQK